MGVPSLSSSGLLMVEEGADVSTMIHIGWHRPEADCEYARRLDLELSQIYHSRTFRLVARLHRPVCTTYEQFPVCRGCDATGAEVESTEWPCTTVVLLGILAGVNPPAGHFTAPESLVNR